MNQYPISEFQIRREEYYFSGLKSEEKNLVDCLNLPLINRTLMTPYPIEPQYLLCPVETAYILTNPVSYFIVENYPTNNMFNYYAPCNQLSTSCLTDEQAFNESIFVNKCENSKSYEIENIAPKLELDLESNKTEVCKSKKKHSEVRLKEQERRLKDNNLHYESRESYNHNTKRVSRVLVCLHDNCGKEFTKTRNLVIHSRVHTKLRPHSCQYCGKGFTQKCNLKKHIELHETGKYKDKFLD